MVKAFGKFFNVDSASAPTQRSRFSLFRGLRRLVAPLGLSFLSTLQAALRIGAFSLITVGTVVTKYRHARRVLRPVVQYQILRAGVRVLPIVCFLGFALGLVIVGQTVQLLAQVGQLNLLGPLLVTVLIRELAPLTAALVVLARVGTAMVAELGTSRALGEVEALEALGIDPIHYLVLPRILGVTVAVICLTAYVIAFALGTGYFYAFFQGLTLRPGEYFGLIADAMSWADFPLLAMKALGFGMMIAMIICYHGLAQPIHLEEVGRATTQTVARSIVACLFIDALFIPVYILL